MLRVCLIVGGDDDDLNFLDGAGVGAFNDDDVADDDNDDDGDSDSEDSGTDDGDRETEDGKPSVLNFLFLLTGVSDFRIWPWLGLL